MEYYFKKMKIYFFLNFVMEYYCVSVEILIIYVQTLPIFFLKLNIQTLIFVIILNIQNC